MIRRIACLRCGANRDRRDSFPSKARCESCGLELGAVAMDARMHMMGDDDGGGDWDDHDEDSDDDTDDDDDDDAPNSKPGFFASILSGVLRDMIGRLIALAIVGVLLLVFCCCGIGIAIFAPKDGVKDRVVQDKRPGVNPDAGPPIASVARGKVLLNEKARLTKTDPRDPIEKVRMKAFPIDLQANTKYVISMNSKVFDAVLRLKDSKGKQVAEDDDSGGDLNARIVYTPSQSGTFRIIATTYHEGELGTFQLTVQEADPEKGEAQK